MEIELPTERSEETAIDPELLIIYGYPKVGKTTLANFLPNNLIMDFENGTKYLKSINVQIIGIKAPLVEAEEDKRKRLEEKKYYLSEVGKAIVQKGRPYDFITIDTVSDFEDMLMPIALEIYKSLPIGATFDGTDILTLPKGAGYKYLRDAFEIYLNKIRKLAKHIILIGHIKDNIVNKVGKEVSAKELDLIGKLKTIACKNADGVGYIYNEGSDLRISFKGSETLVVGSRCKHLRGQNFLIAKYGEDAGELQEVKWGLIYPDKLRQ